tara:strand:- start:577 stop:1980 length:1404 start_codon:yes stop_codon:yes gene_type:complete
MTDLNFIFFSLKSRWLNCLLSVLLTAFGVSIAVLITQFGNTIKERLNKDGEGIDIVVGAKGSPLQLILSSVYHIDIPTGNIQYDEAQKIIRHPQVKKAIPLALGDNWKGFRIVGTSGDYLKHYNAKLSEGRLWDKNFEVVVGSSVKLKLNDEFIGAHGLLDEGKPHHNKKYKVIGITKPTNTVMDRLIFTSVNSVLEIHGQKNIDEDIDNTNLDKENNNNEHESKHYKDDEQEIIIEDHEHTEDHRSEEDHEHVEDHHSEEDHEHVEDHHSEEDHNLDNHHHSSSDFPEITSLLLTTNSPIANINLPLFINKNTTFQAANPAVEITRLTTMLGLGSKSFKILSFILIIIAALSIFSGLASNLENRMNDLAVLRALGYTKNRIFKIICLEGVVIVLSGMVLGSILGIVIFDTMSSIITPLNTIKAKFTLTFEFLFIILIVLFSGIIASVFPAYQASKISVAKQLSKNI